MLMLFPLVLALPGNLMAQSINPDELDRIELQLVKQRQRLSGTITANVRYSVFQQDSNLTKIRTRYLLFFDDDRRRADRIVEATGDPVKSASVITPHQFIRVPSGFDKSVQVYTSRRRPKNPIEVPDARLLGMVVWMIDSISQFNLDLHFLRSDMRLVSADISRDANGTVLKVVKETDDGSPKTTLEYWLASDRDNQPIYIVLYDGERDSPTHQEIFVDLKQWISDDFRNVWFPEKVVFKSVQDDVVHIEQIIDIADANFGPQIGDDQFSLASLDLPVGKSVIKDDELMWWNGSELLPVSDEKTLEPIKMNSRFWLLLLNVVAIAALACAILYRRSAALKHSP